MQEEVTRENRSRDADSLHTAFGREGCPVCLVVHEAMQHGIDAWQYEGFSDVEHRHELIRSRGFCPLHTWQVAQFNTTFQLALVYREIFTDILTNMERDLASAAHQKKSERQSTPFIPWGRGHRRPAATYAEPIYKHCPFCRTRNNIENRLISTLLELLLSEEARARMHQSTGLCLPHFSQARSEAEKGDPQQLHYLLEFQSEALRLQMQKDAFLQNGTTAAYAQAEHLIRFVPQRFQHALADLLLDDERLLVFVERPLLRHRTGWLGTQTWRSNEGLFLVTDRQVLWLRDFLAPGSSFLPGGYIAHMAPVERLQEITILPAGRTPSEFVDRLESKDSPYQRLVMKVGSCTGSEFFVVEFPQNTEIEKALARINSTLRAFLPYPQGTDDRRVRRLPVVEAWLSRGFEAEQLAGLGGIVPADIAQRLEQRLASLVNVPGEELLVSALVPALEDYKSPARLVALTRRALLVLEDAGGKFHRSTGRQRGQTEQVHRYDLTTISSAQLRYSLLGSSLSIFVPQPDGSTEQHVLPFHSPAIAWFLPLFTRLRMLLSGPYHLQ